MEEEIKNPEMETPDNETTDTPTTDNLSTDTPADTETTTNAEPTPEKEEKKSFFGRKNRKEDQYKELNEKYLELEKQKKELNDKFLLLYSEFDNYKKRTNKEKLEMMGTASEKVIVALLPVIDDFERAIKANEKLEDIQVIKDGFNIIYNKLMGLLKRFDVSEIPAKGEEFNTDFHEAVTHFPAPTEEEKGKVIDVTEKGYKIKDKVIRYAKVVVGQ